MPTMGYPTGMRTGTVVLMMLTAGLLGSAEPARASISIAKNVVAGRLFVLTRAATLRCVGHPAGTRRTLLDTRNRSVSARGRASRRRTSVDPPRSQDFPFAKVTRRGPDGMLYALQTWRVEPNGPVELHFSRWKGAPTTVALTAEARLRQRATCRSSPSSRESRWQATRGRTQGSDIGSSPTSTASRAQVRPGVASAASRHARTEHFGYWSNRRTSAGVTA